MSFHFWRNQGQSDKQEFICLKGSYHGETVGALAVTDVALFRDAYGPMIRNAHVVASPMHAKHKQAKPRSTSPVVRQPIWSAVCKNAQEKLPP